jgi:thiol-disulfide isomerase/thioredoxin
LPSTAPAGNPGALAPAGPTFTPAVFVSGDRVHYLSLPDLDGRPWDFTQRRGRLLLIDLWGTWCGPCLQAIPELIRLQSAYGPCGLEVVGIACEQGTWEDSVRKVRNVRQNFPRLNYRLLLGDDGAHKPIETQFGVTAYPTLVLVDADGTIVWRAAGGGRFGELEQTLRRRLAAY